MLQRVVPLVWTEPRLEAILARDLMMSLVAALLLPQNQSQEAALLSLVKDVFVMMHPHSPAVAQALLQLPGVSMRTLEQLCATLEKKSDREQRMVFRNFWVSLRLGGAESGRAPLRAISHVTNRALADPAFRPRDLGVGPTNWLEQGEMILAQTVMFAGT